MVYSVVLINIIPVDAFNILYYNAITYDCMKFIKIVIL